MIASSRIAGRAASALLIRRAAGPLVLRGIADERAWDAAASADAEAWRLFLRVERCALPLQRALTALPPDHPARARDRDAPFRAVLDAVARREASRVLVVRTHLRAVTTVAAATGATVIVLKGGVLVGGPQAVDLVDLDLLAPVREAASFANALEGLGWVATGETSDQVTQSLLAGDMRVELHHALGIEPRASEAEIFDRSTALEGFAPLRRMGPSDHLHYVVHHVAVRHPNRRVRLRDLALIADAARSCTAADLAAAFSGRDDDYTAAVSRATLEAALGSASPAANRAEEQAAVTAYVLASRPRMRALPNEMREFVDMWSISMLQTKWERQQIWAAVGVTSMGLSSRPYIRAIEERHPALGRAWRMTARAAYRAATWMLATPIAARARRTVRLALASPALRRT